MKKEAFFEVLGELDDNFVKEAKTPVKKKIHWKATMAACFAAVAVLGIGILQSDLITTPNDVGDVPENNIPVNEGHTGSFKPVINFEGVVAAVEDGSVILEDGKRILITEDTVFAGDPDTGNAVSEDILVGNFIQGYTEEDAGAAEITASKIWANEGRSSGGETKDSPF